MKRAFALLLLLLVASVLVDGCAGARPVIPCVDSAGTADKTKCEQCWTDPTTCRSGCDASIGICVYPRGRGAYCNNPGQCASQGCYFGKCQ